MAEPIPISFADCFGWIHPGAARRGVVLAAAFGLDGLSAHRAWRDLAERLAARGLPTLRFDWAGTGDGLGDDRDPDRPAAWAASLAAAVDRLKADAKVDEVAIVALRLGALIAAEVAATRSDVALFVAAAPVVSGRAFVREQQTLARMLRVRGDDDPADADEACGHAVAGFFMSEATASELKTRDLRRRAVAPAPRTLVLARDGDAAALELAEHWHGLGATVETDAFPGLDELLTDPTRALIPDAAWSRIVDAIAADVAVETDPRPLSARTPARLVGPTWVEEPVLFGLEPRLFGIMSEPTAPRAPDTAVVLLAAGRNPHVGWGRQTVDLARTLAAAGHRVLRIDQAGIGDSPARPDGPAEVLYAREAIADVRDALALLAARGVARVTLVGACSGAHLALHAAREETAIEGMVLINLQRFVWRDGDSLEAAMRGEYRSSSAYADLIRRRDTWRRIFGGEIKVGSIALELARRLVRRTIAAGHRRLVVPPAVRWLRELGARGCRTLFVFGTDDGGRDEFAAHVGAESEVADLCPGTDLVLIERTDHNLSPRDARRRLTEIVVDYLERAPRRGASRFSP